jgi:hypothetical protein
MTWAGITLCPNYSSIYYPKKCCSVGPPWMQACHYKDQDWTMWTMWMHFLKLQYQFDFPSTVSKVWTKVHTVNDKLNLNLYDSKSLKGNRQIAHFSARVNISKCGDKCNIKYAMTELCNITECWELGNWGNELSNIWLQWHALKHISFRWLSGGLFIHHYIKV